MVRSTRSGVLWLVYALAATAMPGRLTAQEEVPAQVDRLLLEVAVGESGRAVYRLWAEVRNREVQQLVLQLPPGFELTTARLDGFDVAVGVAPGGGLAMPLLPRERVQVVHLDGILPLTLPPQGKSELSLPLPTLSAPAARVAVRALVPGGRTWKLADPSRSGPVQGPPGSSEVRSGTFFANSLARQIEANLADRPAGPELVVAPGYQEITAAWSASSAHPGPLVLRVETASETTPWQ